MQHNQLQGLHRNPEVTVQMKKLTLEGIVYVLVILTMIQELIKNG